MITIPPGVSTFRYMYSSGAALTRSLAMATKSASICARVASGHPQHVATHGPCGPQRSGVSGPAPIRARVQGQPVTRLRLPGQWAMMTHESRLPNACLFATSGSLGLKVPMHDEIGISPRLPFTGTIVTTEISDRARSEGKCFTILLNESSSESGRFSQLAWRLSE